MNAEPHSHTVTINSVGLVSYGDQSDYIRLFAKNCFYYPWEPVWYREWRMRRLVRRLIRKHDRASVRAGRRGGDPSAVAKRVAAEMQPTRTGWASEKHS